VSQNTREQINDRLATEINGVLGLRANNSFIRPILVGGGGGGG